MVKNKITQIVFRTIYVVLGFIGVIGNLGYFNRTFNGNFYLYYTNLSNYICLGIMIFLLIDTIRSFKNEQEGYTNKIPDFRFMSVIMILVTLLVYNILLAKQKPIEEYFFSINNLLMHLLLPIMFVVDWVLFTEHGKTKISYPFLSLVMPLIYVAFILIRSFILGSSYTGILYPYFFLDVSTLGIGGVFLWVLILVVLFVILSFAIIALDKIKQIKAKFNKNNRE